jgi:hypothetical protein
MKQMYMASKLPEDMTLPPAAPGSGIAPPPLDKSKDTNSPIVNWISSASAATKPAAAATTSTKAAPVTPQLVKGESEAAATAHLMKTYTDVYACKDDMASSRPSCSSGGKAIPNATFVSCDNYMNLPDWPELDGAAVSLSKIPDKLPARIQIEVEWYSQIIKKLSDALAMGADPPTSPPNSPNSPAGDSSGKAWSSDGTGAPIKEGFFDFPQCSPAGQQARLERERRAKLQAQQSQQVQPVKQPDPADNPDTCQMPDLESQINRVNALLDSPGLQAALQKSDAQLSSMLKLQSDIQKAKDGNLYDWQKAGPKKTYEQYKGTDRVTAFIYSLKQNQ